MNAAATLLRRLADRGWTIAVAESFTGGLLQDQLTNVPGSSAAFIGGVVAYDNRVKQRFLSVGEATIRRHGAVSTEAVAKMAVGIRRLLHADVGIATSGIAGPGGATATKPVGLSYVAVATGRATRVERRVLQGSRRRVKERAVLQALQLALKAVPPQPSKSRRVSRRS